MSDVEQFEQLVLQLMSDETEVRTNAESTYRGLQGHPDAWASYTLATMTDSSNPVVRQMCAVLLRRDLFDRPEEQLLWTHLSEQVMTTVQTQLLRAFQEEQVPMVMRAICENIADCFSLHQKQEQEWPELLPFLFPMATHSNPDVRLNTLFVFARMCAVHDSPLRQFAEPLRETFATGLTDSNSFAVRLMGLNATTQFLCSLRDSETETMTYYEPLLPAMLEIVSDGLNSGVEDHAMKAIQFFIDISEFTPKALRPALDHVVNAMLQIATTEKLLHQTRQLALEFLTKICESAPAMMRKFDKFMDNVLPVCLTMMVAVEDSPGWQEHEDEDEFEELQDDFIQIAQAEQPVNDADGFDDTEWALEYARVMEPEKYERIMQSRSEMGFNSVFGGGSDESGVAYTEASSTFVSMVPVHGTPYSVASTVNRPRAGLHEIDDERLEGMMEKDYEIDQIGELPFSRDTRGNMSVADFEAIIEDVLAGKVLRKHFKREVLLEPVRDMPDLRQRILAAAARQAEVDGTTPQPQPGDELDAAMGFKPRAQMPEHDVESILSLNSNVSNHPRKIQSHSGRSTIKSSATTTPTIPARNTAPKGSRADADAGPAPGSGTSADAAADDDEYEYVYDDGSVNVVNEGMKRPANETKAEKRARKKAIKEARRAARQRKKANRAAFKSEAKVLKKQTMPHDGVRPGDSIIRY